VGHVNVYLVQGDNGCLLVDTGWDTKGVLDCLKQQLAEKSINLEDIAQILVTHTHPDHYGLAGKIKQLTQAKLAMHHLEEDSIKSRYVSSREFFQQEEEWWHINGVSTEETPEFKMTSVRMANYVTPVLPDIALSDGEAVS